MTIPAAEAGVRKRTALGAAAAFLVVAALVAAFVGAADLNPLATAAALIDKAAPFLHLPTSLDPLDKAVLFQIRLPRVVLGALVGGLLALAGAGYQGVFRNPLVDSGMLGASAGAGPRRDARDRLPRRRRARRPSRSPRSSGRSPGSRSPTAPAPRPARHTVLGDGVATLLLAGIAVGSFLTAVQTFVLQRSASDIEAVYSWLLGSLSAASWQQVTTILPYAAVSSVVILLHGRHLDVLAVGDEEARALGLRPGLIRAIVVAASALAAASAVAVSGLIGFVGIVIPHVARRLAGPRPTPACCRCPCSSAPAFLVLADTLARTVLSPAELPIGVVTALRRRARVRLGAARHPPRRHLTAGGTAVTDLAAVDVTVTLDRAPVLSRRSAARCTGGGWLALHRPERRGEVHPDPRHGRPRPLRGDGHARRGRRPGACKARERARTARLRPAGAGAAARPHRRAVRHARPDPAPGLPGDPGTARQGARPGRHGRGWT